MECNKDEAARAKELAEKKLTDKDIAGAKYFALKALDLFPGLDGLPQLMETIDIYVAYERKVSGEVDWYGILGIEPSADEETIKRQYRKLALALHPDKNKAVGADGAFKILSEAWSLLSDKVKRVAYEQRRNIRFPYQRAAGRGPSNQTGMNGFRNFTANPSSVRNPSATNARARPTTPTKPNSFWTLCRKCNMNFEYLKVYRNQNLRCANCRQPFLATEVPPPPVKAHMSSKPSFYHHQQQGVNNATTDGRGASGRKFPCMGTSNFSCVSSTSAVKIQPVSLSKRAGVGGPAMSFTEAASNLHQAKENLKKHCESSAKGAVSEAAVRNKTNRPTKKRRVTVDESIGNSNGKVHQMDPESGGCRQRNLSHNQKGNSWGERTMVPGNKPKIVGEWSVLKLRNMYMEKARMDISKKLDEWRTTASSQSASKEDKENQTSTSAAESAASVMKAEERNNMVQNAHVSQDYQKSDVFVAHVDLEAKGTGFVTMDVPDPDFHDFDMDRTEDSFSENQVWAAYDDDDGMPRFYALIHGILCKKPFKMRISWLNAKTNEELGPLDWVDSGFAKTCGDFRAGKQEISKTLNSFSHMVKWTKGAKGLIHIFPKKGEIWALYRNWSSDWNELTPDEVIHMYDMVEVLDDFKEHEGVVVGPLAKVAGFKSVFFTHTDSSRTWTIPREELFRFSHQVPSYLLTGQEGLSAPRGCRELDPAAMPLELLQVLQEDTVTGDVKNAKNPADIERLEGEKALVGAFANMGSSVDVNLRLKEPIVTYARKRKGKKMVGDAD